MLNRQKKCEKKTCATCHIAGKCDKTCLYIEGLLSEVTAKGEHVVDFNSRIHTKDYKEVLVECMESAKRNDSIDIFAIRGIPDTKLKGIACMLYGGLKVAEIADLLKISQTQVYRTIHKGVL
jgi:hypothetical protein